jgi:GTP-binding protein
LIEGYLRRSSALRGVVQLLDIRHTPTADDRQMLDFLAEIEVPTVVVLTKVDKLKPREIPERIHDIAVLLQLDEEQMIPFSAVSNAGRDDLADALMTLVATPRE